MTPRRLPPPVPSQNARRRARAAVGAAAALAWAAPRAGAQPSGAQPGAGIARPDETVAVAWSAVARALPAAGPGRVRVVDPGSGREVPSQLVTGTGAPDSLVFQASFRPREAKRFAVEAAAPAAPYPARTYARHDEPRDDLAWESDRIAWRMYGQGLKKTPSAMSSSGVDIWVKRTRDLVVERWYKKGHDEYHVDTGEGASETRRISIDAGSNLFREESTFRAADGSAAELPYAAGEIKRAGMVGTTSRAHAWAWLTGWGPVSPKKGGHGELGTAVLLPRERVTNWKETADHYLAVSHATPGRPVVHYVGAGWTDSGDFRDVRDWWRYLDDFAERLASPVRVTVGGPATAAAR